MSISSRSNWARPPRGFFRPAGIRRRNAGVPPQVTSISLSAGRGSGARPAATRVVSLCRKSNSGSETGAVSRPHLRSGAVSGAARKTLTSIDACHQPSYSNVCSVWCTRSPVRIRPARPESCACDLPSAVTSRSQPNMITFTQHVLTCMAIIRRYCHTVGVLCISHLSHRVSRD